MIVEKGLQRQEGLPAYLHAFLNVKSSTKSSRGLDVNQFDLLYQNRRTKYSIARASNDCAVVSLALRPAVLRPDALM